LKGATSMESQERILLTRLARGAMLLFILFLLGSCIFGIPDYTLTVIVEEGVTGTPETGKYVYKELHSVEYQYTPLNPLHTVEVMLNNRIRRSSQGSVVLYGDNYILAARVMDIRGSWTVKMIKSGSTITDFQFTLTISGADVISGTFTDSRGYQGVWETASAETGNTITFTYSDWEDYVLTGTYFNMSGTFSGEETTGTWSAERTTGS